jgi:hypothetical protein
MKKILSVGLILDQGLQPFIIKDLIDKSKEGEFYSIDYLIIQNTQLSGKRSLKKYLDFSILYRTITSLFFSLIFKFEKGLLLKNHKFKKYFVLHDFNYFLIPSVKVNPIVSKSGFIFSYSQNDLDQIKKLNLDVLIRGGSGILRGEILNICKFGILSLHHGNNDINRGGPPGFWEVYLRIPETGFIIQKLCNELDGGDVYVKGAIPTSTSYLLNLVRVHRIANIYFDRLLNSIAEKNVVPTAFPKRPYYNDLYRLPSIKVQLTYLVKTFVYKFKRVILNKLGYRLNWSVAYGFNENWKNVELRKLKKIINPFNRFYADPFVYSDNGQSICFVEDYNYETGRGKISAIELTTKGYTELGTALEEKFHMSYPFIFKYENELYMCPETHEIGEIRLYKCFNFPLKWEYHKTIMKNISASDTSIFFQNNKWWILTNIDSAELGDHCSELHLFFSDSFDSENWESHPLNPIIFSPLKARNGGLFVQGNDLYRVFQVQGFDNYGESMGVAKILEISEQNYREEVIFDIKPSYFKNLKGTHTFSGSSHLVAIDYSMIEKTNKN